jgi:hypothetical protein
MALGKYRAEVQPDYDQWVGSCLDVDLRGHVGDRELLLWP